MIRLHSHISSACIVLCAWVLGAMPSALFAQQPRVRFPPGASGEVSQAQFQSPSPVAPAPLAPITPFPGPSSAFGTPSNLSPQFGGGTGGFSPLPSAGSPVGAGSPAGGASLGLPQFDPYATGAASTRPSLLPSSPPAFGSQPAAPPAGGSLFGPPVQPPPGGVAPSFGTPPAYGAPPGYGAPAYGAAPYTAQPYATPGYGAPGYGAPGYGAPGYGAPGYGAPGYGAPGYGTSPLVNPVPQPYYNPSPYATPYGGSPYGAPGGYGQASPMFPNGAFNWGGQGGVASGPPYERLFQNSGLRYSWLRGADGAMLEMNEAEVFTTMVWNNFIFNDFPLRITPGFAVDFLSGPQPPITSDLPAALYSAYVEFNWAPQITPNFGAQFVVRPGIHSDFNAFNADSFRISALGLGVMQVSPEVAVKLGVWYIDRNNLKLLPSGGIVWTPTEQARFDISFPSPKLSHYVTTVGNWEFWGYLGGEYGGGAWTIKRQEAPMAGASERVDINDIRVFAGVEWTTERSWKGFAEVGYVFEREIVYVLVPADSVNLTDTLMVRAGFAF